MAGKTIVIGCVQNEADIIEHFVRHTLGFADRMVLVLHRSVDATGDILRLLQAEGLPLDIRWLEHTPYGQSGMMKDLLHEVRHEPSVARVIPLDADEFLVTTNGIDTRTAVEALPTDCVTTASMRMYAPSEGAETSTTGIAACPCRVAGDPFPAIKTIAIPCQLLGGRLSQGNHRYRIEGAEAPEKTAGSLTLAHFPIRSVHQLQSKALCWIREYLVRSREPNDCFHWRDMYTDLRAGKLETATDVRRWALQYAEYVIPGSSQHVVDDPITLPPQKYGHLAARLSPQIIAQQLGLELGLEYIPGMSLSEFAGLLEAAARERVLTTGSGTATVAATHATHVRHDRQEAIGG